MTRITGCSGKSVEEAELGGVRVVGVGRLSRSSGERMRTRLHGLAVEIIFDSLSSRAGIVISGVAWGLMRHELSLSAGGMARDIL